MDKEKLTVVKIEKSDNLSYHNNDFEELQGIDKKANTIHQQNFAKSLFAGNKNIRSLAENDKAFSKVIKGMLNWLLAVSNAELLRREEYDDLIAQMIRFDDDINEQAEMQLKFKKAYDNIQIKHDEILKLKRKIFTYKLISVISALLSIIAILISILF